MDGVDTARVHLALPEKALFRDDRSEPKAAVTIAMKPGITADPARVAGIQRLVASAVPDLPESKVVVLDSSGRVISADAVAAPDADRSPDVEEKAAIEGYYRARARGAIERAMPGVKFTLRVLALPIADASAPAAVPGHDSAAAPAAAAPAGWVPSGEGAGRNFRVRMIFVSEAGINPDDQNVVRSAVTQATSMSTEIGDELSFETGPVDQPAPAAQLPAALPSAAAIPPVPTTATPASGFEWPPLWAWLAAAALAIGFVILRVRSAGRARLDESDHEDFAARLRRQLALAGEDSDASA
jgi:flagellar M-ring protein FliF